MNDLISRQALCEYALNQKDKSVTPNDIMRFPPAELKTCVYWDRESNFCALHRPSAELEWHEWHDCDPTDKSTLPEPGSWAIWSDKEGHRIIARWKEDAIDHFFPDQRMFDFNLEDAVAWMEIPERTKNAKELPPAEPEQRWIPVTDGFPEKRDWYLGIFKDPDTGWINHTLFICDYVGKETKATTKEGWILKDCTDRDEHIDYYFNLECVAWRPLLKPYSERRQE